MFHNELLELSLDMLKTVTSTTARTFHTTVENATYCYYVQQGVTYHFAVSFGKRKKILSLSRLDQDKQSYMAQFIETYVR